MRRQVYTVFLTILLVSSCISFDEIEPKPLVFSQSYEDLLNEIKGTYDFFEVGIGSNTSFNRRDTTYILNLSLVNGEIPQQKDSLRWIGKVMMSKVIQVVENESDFDEFSVEFVEQTEKGKIIYSEKDPYEYSIKELKSNAP